METFWQDLAYGARRLWKSRAFTIVSLLSLGIGIGANSAIFSVTNALLLRPLPYKDAERLVILWQRSPGLNVVQDWFSPGQYMDIKLENKSFDEVAATIGVSFNMTGRGTPENVEGALVTSSLFRVTGAQPLLGRVLLPEDDQKDKPQGIVLTYGFWRRQFASDQDVIGQSLTLNDKSYTIIGVMPADFSLNKDVMPTVDSIQRAELLLPLQFSDGDRAERGHEDYNVFARLRPGVERLRAQAEMDALADQMKQQYPATYPPEGELTISVVPLLDQVVGDTRRALYVLLGAVALVLLIACANVANLLLSRAAIRQKEIAIRAAVGATRVRIIRQLVTESLLLSFCGGLVGLMLALVAIRLLRVFGPENVPRLHEINIDVRVLLFTFAISIATGVVFGLLPALRASRTDLNEILKDGSRSSGAGFGKGHQRVRRLLVVSEIGLSLVLLIAAALLVRSYQRIQRASPGYDVHNVVSLRMFLPPSRYPDPSSVVTFFQKLDERTRSVPGIESVATTYLLPLSSNALGWGPVVVDGYVPQNPQELIISNEGFVAPDYFASLKIPLVRGRYFDEQDRKGSREVAIVDESFAERFWPGEDPIGRRVQRRDGGPWWTIVGVVSYEKEFSFENEPAIRIYYPINQIPVRRRYLIARSTTDPIRTTAAIAEQIRAVDPEIPVFDAKPMEWRLNDSLAQRRFSMLMLGTFSVLALTLASIGIYGVMSYWVSQRTHEIGIRMALGAAPASVMRLVVSQALVLTVLGIGAGLVAAFALTRLMSSLLFGVSASDPLPLVAISLLLACTATLASVVPARRAARVDPMIALRYE